MDEFGESYESDSSFDSRLDFGDSESFDSFDLSDMSFTESEPLSEDYDETPLEDYSSDTAELPFDEAAPLDDPDIVPNDISEELDTLDALEDDPSAMLDKAPEEDMSYFEDASLEDTEPDETTEISEEIPLDETVSETEEIPESSDTEELPFDEDSQFEDSDIVSDEISEEPDTVEEDSSAMLDEAPEEDLSLYEDASLEDTASGETTELPEEITLDETVPESDEFPESTDSFDEIPFDEAETAHEMPETPEETEVPDESDSSLPIEEMPEAEIVETEEDNSGVENFEFETAPETLDDQNPETVGEFAPSDNPNGESWEQFSEEVNEGDDQQTDWDSLQEVPFAGEETLEGQVEDKPYESVGEYLSAHNYGQEDFETYSQDPEWRELMRNEYPDYELPELSQESAQEQLNQYMSEHNYGVEDYDEYSQDPTWRELHSTVFPDDELPPLNEETAEAIEPSFEDLTNIESPEAVTETQEDVAEMPEDVPEMVEESDEVPEAEEPEERVYNEFEQSIMETDPEFYESGEFLEQGVNKHGFEGTCGETTQANTLNRLLGTNEFTEDKVLDVALDNNLCFSEGDPASCGGTTTEQFMDLYDKMNEQLDGAISTELYEYDDALGVEEVAQQLEDGNVVNVAVDSNALWGYTDYVDEMGVPVDDVVSDHWITVTGVERNDFGEIEGFNILDSGGGENYVSTEKYHDICFGTDEHKVLDPTTIVVSKVENVNG